MIEVFLDANVYFAGCFSKTGASSVILELAQRKKIFIYASRLVLHEAERNLRKKTNPKAVAEFHQFLKQTKIRILPPLENSVCARYEHYIHPKDVPVLAAADKANVDFLITLDRRHFLTSKIASLPTRMKILTPGDFLVSQLPH